MSELISSADRKCLKPVRIQYLPTGKMDELAVGSQAWGPTVVTVNWINNLVSGTTITNVGHGPDGCAVTVELSRVHIVSIYRSHKSMYSCL